MPLRSRGSSPAAIAGRTWETNGTGHPGAHLSSIGGGGRVGAGSGDGRRRGYGGTAAVARFPAQCRQRLGHVGAQKLRWGLGKGLESLGVTGASGVGSSPAAPMVDGGGQELWRAHEGRKGQFYRLTTRRGGFARASSPKGVTAWARGWLSTCDGWRPMEKGGALIGEC
jgi:hypothetical protein